VMAASPARTETITFEELAVGSVLSDQYDALGVVFSGSPFSGPGTSTSGEPWATNSDMTIVSSAGSDVGSLGTPPLVSGNVLRSQNGWRSENGDPSFLMTFSTAISSISVDFAGVSSPIDVRLFVYDGADLLATVVVNGTGQITLSHAAESITHVAVSPGSYDDWVCVDNVVFEPVPEPSLGAMMSLGVAVLGVVARRRRA
jgi:hypothetical protein